MTLLQALATKKPYKRKDDTEWINPHMDKLMSTRDATADDYEVYNEVMVMHVDWKKRREGPIFPAMDMPADYHKLSSLVGKKTKLTIEVLS